MSLAYSFAGKSVLVTGGSRGIGRQIVQRFLEGGARVFAIGRNPQSVAKLQNELPGVTASAVDVADWKATKSVIQSFGDIDHLVNNAGIVLPQTLLQITRDSAQSQYDVNVGAVMNITQIVSQQMIRRKHPGTIVNIASVDGRKYYPNSSVYCASKAAVESLTKSMAIELGAHNIRVNAVLPGAVRTEMYEADNCGEELTQHLNSCLEKVIIKRFIEPDEIADLVLFLLSPLSRMIVGEGVVIDGGWLLV